MSALAGLSETSQYFKDGRSCVESTAHAMRAMHIRPARPTSDKLAVCSTVAVTSSPPCVPHLLESEQSILPTSKATSSRMHKSP